MQKFILAFALLPLSLIITSCSAGAQTSGSATTVETSTVTATASTSGCQYISEGTAARQVSLPSTDQVVTTGTVAAVLKLNGTALKLTLDAKSAPCTVNSFTSLARQKYFDNTSCHRLVDADGLYVLQCGDPTGTGSGGPGYRFADELSGKETYPAGTLAMANSGTDTNGSQFFMVYQDSSLPASYTVFGHLDAAGIAVVTKLAAGGQDGSFGSSGGGKPKLPAVINSVTIG